MSTFRAYRYFWDPTMMTITADGVELLTLASALDLAKHTAIPAYSMATEQYAMIEGERLQWTTVGTFGRFLAWPERVRLGIHLPKEIAVEITAHCERYVREHPDTPLIPRTEIAYRRNGYSTTHSVLYTYNQLRDSHDDCIRKFDRGSSQGDEGRNQRSGAPPPRGHGQARNAPRQGTRNVAALHTELTDSLFDEEGGGDRD